MKPRNLPAVPTDPTPATRMISSTEILSDVESLLGLTTVPVTTTAWCDRLYTCTYHLPTGRLVLSVKESPDAASANTYFAGLRRLLPAPSCLNGAKGLGGFGYESRSGVVIILKDGKTLKVDATGMPPVSGPHLIARADLAYEITTGVLDCWAGE